jgi:hypothetical protein
LAHPQLIEFSQRPFSARQCAPFVTVITGEFPPLAAESDRRPILFFRKRTTQSIRVQLFGPSQSLRRVNPNPLKYLGRKRRNFAKSFDCPFGHQFYGRKGRRICRRSADKSGARCTHPQDLKFGLCGQTRKIK